MLVNIYIYILYIYIYILYICIYWLIYTLSVSWQLRTMQLFLTYLLLLFYQERIHDFQSPVLLNMKCIAHVMSKQDQWTFIYVVILFLPRYWNFSWTFHAYVMLRYCKFSWTFHSCVMLRYCKFSSTFHSCLMPRYWKLVLLNFPRICHAMLL